MYHHPPIFRDHQIVGASSTPRDEIKTKLNIPPHYPRRQLMEILKPPKEDYLAVRFAQLLNRDHCF